MRNATRIAVILSLVCVFSVNAYTKEDPVPPCTPVWHEMVHTQAGRAAVLVQLGELRLALMSLPPSPSAVQREVILQEAQQLEDLVQKYRDTHKKK